MIWIAIILLNLATIACLISTVRSMRRINKANERIHVSLNRIDAAEARLATIRLKRDMDRNAR